MFIIIIIIMSFFYSFFTRTISDSNIWPIVIVRAEETQFYFLMSSVLLSRDPIYCSKNLFSLRPVMHCQV